MNEGIRRLLQRIEEEQLRRRLKEVNTTEKELQAIKRALYQCSGLKTIR